MGAAFLDSAHKPFLVHSSNTLIFALPNNALFSGILRQNSSSKLERIPDSEFELVFVNSDSTHIGTGFLDSHRTICAEISVSSADNNLGAAFLDSAHQPLLVHSGNALIFALPNDALFSGILRQNSSSQLMAGPDSHFNGTLAKFNPGDFYHLILFLFTRTGGNHAST